MDFTTNYLWKTNIEEEKKHNIIHNVISLVSWIFCNVFLTFLSLSLSICIFLLLWSSSKLKALCGTFFVLGVVYNVAIFVRQVWLLICNCGFLWIKFLDTCNLSCKVYHILCSQKLLDDFCFKYDKEKCFSQDFNHKAVLPRLINKLWLLITCITLSKKVGLLSNYK